jgi:SDR family mycofactocin-dependent oxidoreductase
MGTLDGKIAFITGGARGQGRSHAVTLAEHGADVVIVDIDHDIESVFYPLATADDMDETMRLIDKTGRQALARTVDVRDSAALDAIVAEAVATFGHIDIVSANAGIATTMRKTWEMSDSDWQDVIDVNLTGVWRTVKAVVPPMIAAERGGCIVLTSSLAGLKGYSNIAGYVAAKHGVNGLMRTLANELGPYNIRVNTVCPGLIHTDMMMNQPTYDIFRPEIEHPSKEEATEVFRSMQVLPTDWLEPRDVSEVIAWLASDSARFITGTAIPVDAGQIGRG